jgi:hypothetical protein
MTDSGLTKLGGACAILAGVLLPASAIAYLLMPSAQQSWADPAAYLVSFAEVPTFAMIEYSMNAVIAVLGLAVVVAIPGIIRPVHEGWLRWATTLGILGYSVIALQYLRELALIPSMAERFLVADTSTRAVTAANLYLVLLDPQGWITYGAVGAWLLAINILALAGTRWPRQLSYVGIAGGIGYWLVVAGTVLRMDALVTIAVVAGVLLAPIWLIWMGLVLRRATR